ncbi:MAG: hypothetical protein M3Q15_01125, partial [Pseudomonadota bacterium]|nr:hypothetical protein [Pseudomonadota bacterium]
MVIDAALGGFCGKVKGARDGSRRRRKVLSGCMNRACRAGSGTPQLQKRFIGASKGARRRISMKKIIMTMAAVSALAVAAPATAQYADTNISARIQQLQLRLQAGVQNRAITRNEAVSLREQLRQLSMLE